MANQIIIDIGAVANDGTGDPLRTAFNYVNDNFSNVWATGVTTANISFVNNSILTVNTNGNLYLAPNGIGKVVANVDVLPSINYAQSLGSITKRWNTLYVRDIEADGYINGQLGNISIDVGNLHVSGGSNGYVLQTDGEGNLTWTAQTGGGGNGTPGGANTQIQYNDAGAFGGSSGFTFDNVTGNLDVSGNINFTGIYGASLAVSDATVYGNIHAIDGNFTGTVTGNLSMEGGVGQIPYTTSDGILRTASQGLNYDSDSSTLYVKVGSFSGDPSNGNDALYAGKAGATYLGPSVMAQFTGDIENYTQVNFQNLNNSYLASGDYIITADNGTDTSHFIDLGMTSSTWNGSQTNSLGNLIGPNNGYLYVQDGNLTIGTKVDDTANVWTFDTAGNLTLPGNSFAVNYANGTQITLGGNYSDSNVVSLLSAFGSNAISTTGNVTADNFIGNSNINLIAGDYTLVFDNTGALNLTNFGVIRYDAVNIVSKNFSQLQWVDSGNINLENPNETGGPSNWLYVANDGAWIETNINGNTQHSWKFDVDGYTQIPGDVGAAGNVDASNFTSTGQVSVNGNISTASYFIGDGSQLTNLPTQPGTYGNSNVATLLADFGSNAISTTGNITGGNFIGVGANVDLVAGAYDWIFGNNGNLTLPGNTFAVNYANGTPVSLNGNYTNSNVVALLSDFGSNVISTSGNVTAGNVTTNLVHASTVTNLDGSLTLQTGSSYDLILNPSANISAGTNYINNLANPVQPQDAATKKYVDDNSAGLNIHDPVLLASTQDLATYTGATVTYDNGTAGVGATLTLSGNTLTTLDGVSITGGPTTRLLIKNEANAVLNGIYTYTSNTVLTRATDMDQPNEITGGDYIFVQEGVTQASSSWVEQGAVGTVGVGNITFAQFSASQTYSAGNALTLNGSQFNVNVDNTTVTINGSDQLQVGAVPAANVTGLATVATSGAYSDLSGTPTNLTDFTNGPGYITSATANVISVNGLTGAVSLTIPTNTNELTNGNGFITSATANVISVNGRTGVVTVTEYSNAAVSSYLASGTDSANIITTGNISGSYIFGNGSQLTGLPAGYGNSNVVTLLSAYGSNTISTTGNITSGNLTTSGNITGNTNGFAIGYRDIPQISFAANATINISDAGKHYYSTSASNLTLTIANSASQNFAVGAAINLINLGTANITVAQGSGVTLYIAGNATSGNRTVTSYGTCTIQKVATDTWFLVGVGVV